MSREKEKSGRRRVSREDVRKNAASGGRRSFFKLPAGVREWAPDKAGSYLIDVIPYEVKSEDHPDNIAKGVMWYKYPFKVHKNLGPDGKRSEICPTSIGKPCPICKDREKLSKSKDSNQDQIKALNWQNWVAYGIIDPDDKDRVAVFAVSKGKFPNALEKELEEGDESILNFYDVVNGDGRTMKVRFSDAKFEGRAYLEATRIDFIEREDMDEDEILGKSVCLEACLDVLPFDKLNAIYLQLDDEGNPAGETAEAAEERKGKEPEPEAEPEAEAPEWKKGDDVQFTEGKKLITGTIVRIKGDEVMVKGSDNELYDTTVDALEAQDAPEEEPAEEAEPEPEADPDTPEAEASELEEGSAVQWDDDGDTKTGTIKSIDAEKGIARVTDEDGDTIKMALADLTAAEPAEEEEPEPEPEPTKPTPKGGKPGTKPTHAPAAKGGKPTAAAPAGKGGAKKCPHKGGTFGKDCDKYGDECDKCPIWVECEKASA